MKKCRKKLFIKITLGNILVLVISLLAVGLISYNKSSASLQSQLETSTIQTLNEVDKGFSQYISKMTQELHVLEKNNNIQNLANAENYDITSKLAEHDILSIKNTLNGIENVYYSGEYGGVILDNNVTTEEELPFRSKDWYVNAKANVGKIIYTEPYVDQITGKQIMSMSKGIVDSNGNFIGVIGMDINLDELQEYVSDIKLLNTGYVTVIDKDGKVILNSDKNQKQVDDITSFFCWDKIKSEDSGVYSGKIDNDFMYVSQLTNKDTSWKIVGFVGENEIKENLSGIKSTIIISLSVCFIISVIVSFILASTITKDVKKINIFMRKVADGNFSEEVNVSSKDEIGELAENINYAINNVSNLLMNIDKTALEVYDSASSISSMSEETTASVSEVANAINGVSTGATEQAVAVDSVTNTVNGLASKIDEVETNTISILNLSNMTEKLSNDGLDTLNVLIKNAQVTRENTEESNEIFKEMSDSVKKINYISNAISEITEQTNLLALNASIEAARAGDAGKGFAVVAEEIRVLAEQSKNSTDEIKQIVSEINVKSINSAKAMKESIDMLKAQDESVENTRIIFNKIVDSLSPLIDAIKSIGNLTKNMNTDKGDVIKEIDNISSVSQDVASVSEEVTASAEEVTATMDELTDHASKLNDIAETLKNELKAFKL